MAEVPLHILCRYRCPRVAYKGLPSFRWADPAQKGFRGGVALGGRWIKRAFYLRFKYGAAPRGDHGAQFRGHRPACALGSRVWAVLFTRADHVQMENLNV